MKKIILTVGASCSGKTTWAEQFIADQEVREDFYGVVRASNNWVNINRDDLRFQLFTNGVRDWTKYKFKHSNEKRVTSLEDQLAFNAALEDKNIVISNTNLNPSIRQKWKDFAETHGYEYEEKIFHCLWEELVKRNAQREGGIPESILWSQYKRFMQQYGYIGEHPVEVYQPQRNLDFCVICDIDGCVADMRGIRKPYDWELVSQDKPRSEVIAMLDGLALRNGNVIFMSGRDGVCYEDTLAWLEKHITSSWHPDIKWDLVMREQGDSRKDDIVKYELYQQHVKDIYNVAAVLDDRLQVIRMWTVLGLPNIIQVGDYLNEF